MDSTDKQPNFLRVLGRRDALALAFGAMIGWSWVVAMVTVAVSSLFIRQINPGSFSLIHLLSGWTLIALPMALFAVRRGWIASHARGMTWTFIGGLIVAGAFTFPAGSKDSAVLLDLAPGNYGIQDSGNDSSSGLAIIEAYEKDDNA